MKQNKTTKHSQAFSLMEVLISIFLLTVGLLAFLALITKSMRVSMDARNQIIAAQLSQEGLELAINIKETRKLNNLNYDLLNHIIHRENEFGTISLDRATHAPGSTTFDYSSDAVNGNFCIVSEGVNDPTRHCNWILKYDDSTGYTHNNTGNNTTFKRQIGFWYPGYINPVTKKYERFFTCSNAVFSMVWWGKDSPGGVINCTPANKCAVSVTSIETEKNVDNEQQCQVIDGTPFSITYE